MINSPLPFLPALFLVDHPIERVAVLGARASHCVYVHSDPTYEARWVSW